jgi:hypothetical protein
MTGGYEHGMESGFLDLVIGNLAHAAGASAFTAAVQGRTGMPDAQTAIRSGPDGSANRSTKKPNTSR